MSDTPRTDNLIRNPRWNLLLSDLCRELERENAALRADKARLDWLDKTGCWVTIPGARNYASGSSRDVIDAAMQEAKQ